MAYMLVHGFCAHCKAQIHFNPNYVPSIRINGVREAICATCFTEWNRIHRTSQGLDPLPLHPEAYEAEEVP